MMSQKFRDIRTGEIKTVLPLLDIPYFDKYNGPLDVGEFDCGVTTGDLARDAKDPHDLTS